MYNPRLNTAAVRAASVVLAQTAALCRDRAARVEAAPGAIAATGFAGTAAVIGLAGFPLWALRIFSIAALFEHAAVILESSASAQEKLNGLAHVALNLHLAEVVYQLNTISFLLDLHTARALRGLLPAEDGLSDTLADHPGESVEAIDARLAATLPASTLRDIRGAGGMVLETGPGGTTVIIGDTVDPARVTTMVAGVSTGDPKKLAGELDKARSVAAAAGGAVVVWQGYTPPPSVIHGIDPLAARTGGVALAEFQAALRERYPDARLTVLSHSYGTVVATRAAQGPGLVVDDLWLLGSPGVGVPSVDKLELLGADPQVFVADADRDPITATRFRHDAAHGYSPSAESFGATRIDGVRGDHGAYFTDPALLRALSTSTSAG
ncbi:alpha/beta hydrolase family protein [Corynebacterium sanguinis]|uniref:alpha/beta hydrolase family protein n=1 Tax=Corynebacterium sanguinis TaxID=2594913 RepID=UPI00223B566B|nr:alpha/beta hydrolase family protein [Corynebacterium sanguinis]MCT1414271.1 alpha/beta hydrolase family protein [Corynebacterium sanguinis]